MKLVVVLMSLICGLAFADENSECQKYKTAWQTLCGASDSRSCQVTDPKALAQLLTTVNDVVAPNKKLIEAHRAFASNPKPTTKDVEAYYEKMASACLAERWKLVQAAINSAPAEKVAAILRTVANQSIDQQPTLLGTSIDIAAMSRGHDKGIIKLNAQGLAELKQLSLDLKTARQEVTAVSGTGDSDGLTMIKNPQLAKKVSQLEVQKSEGLRTRLKDWANKNLH